MNGQTAINHDILYLPHVMAGTPLAQTKKYGFLAITLTHAIFIPSMTHSVRKPNALSSEFEVSQSNVAEYGGLPFWDVVQTRAMGLTPIELSEFLFQMAKSIEGSLLVDLEEVTDIKITLTQLKIIAGEKGFSIGIGIGSNNKAIARRYLAQNFSFAGVGVPERQFGLVTQLAVVACLFLVLAIGMGSMNQGPDSEELVQKALDDIDRSSAAIMKAAELEKKAAKIFNQRNDQLDAVQMYLDRFEKARENEAERDFLKNIAQGVARSKQKAKKYYFEGCIESFMAKNLVLKAEKQVYRANAVLLDNLNSEADLEKVRVSQEETVKSLKRISPKLYGKEADCEGIYWKRPFKLADLSEEAKLKIELAPEIVREGKSKYHQVGIGKPAWYYRLDIRNQSKQNLKIVSVKLEEKRGDNWQPALGLETISEEYLRGLLIEEDLISDLNLEPNSSAASFVNYYQIGEDSPTKLKWQITVEDEKGKRLTESQEVVLVKD